MILYIREVKLQKQLNILRIAVCVLLLFVSLNIHASSLTANFDVVQASEYEDNNVDDDCPSLTLTKSSVQYDSNNCYAAFTYAINYRIPPFVRPSPRAPPKI